MARLNPTNRITGAPRPRKQDAHTAATKAAHESGLVDWAKANGFPHAEKLASYAAGRRMMERARERAD